MRIVDAPPAISRTRGAGVGLLVGLLLGTILTADSSRAAAPSVYFSPFNNGDAPATPPEIPSSGQTMIYLYLDGGSSASLSDPCFQGPGEEVCGWDIKIQAVGGLSLVSFDGAGDVVSHISGDTLRFNGGDVGSGTLGAVKLGDLLVIGAADSSLELLTSQSINSMLGTETIAPSSLLTTPEPGLGLGLLIGSAFLGLSSRRAHRSAQRSIRGRNVGG